MLRSHVHAARKMATINIAGITLPRLSFGLGSLMKWAPNHAYPLPTDSSLEVRQAIAAGFRHFNTGDLYTNNASAAQALRDSGLKREEVFLSLKLNTFASLGCVGREGMIERAKREVERWGERGMITRSAVRDECKKLGVSTNGNGAVGEDEETEMARLLDEKVGNV